MKVTNNNITLEFNKKFDFDEEEDDHTFYTISAHFNDDSITSEPVYATTVYKKDINDIIANFVLATDDIKASESATEVNEILVLELLAKKPKVIDDICTTLSFALTEDEKVMSIYGEANLRFTTMLKSSDIARDLHSYARKLSYSKALQMNDYQLTKWFVLSFLNTMQFCILECGRNNPFKEELDEFDGVYLAPNSIYNKALRNEPLWD